MESSMLNQKKAENSTDEVFYNLREGISLSNVRTSGATFEIDLENDLADLKFDDNKTYFDNDRIMQNLNYAHIGGDTETESDDSTDDQEPFDKLRMKMQPLTDDGAVMKRIKKQGFGGLPPKNAEITVHYNTYLEYSDEPFDSTRLRDKPFKFFLEDGRVIAGLDVGVASMRKSEVAEFLITSVYAYGSMGCPPRIPANATVLCVVELLNFIDAAVVVEFNDMNPEDRDSAPFPKLLEVCKIENRAANELFKIKNYNSALYRYNKALRKLQKARMANEDEEKEQQHLLLKLFCNVTMCHLNLNAPDRAIPTALSALKIDPQNIKALFRCGKAHRLNGNFSDARRFLQQAARKEPNNHEVANEIAVLSKDIAEHHELEKQFCSKMFPQNVKTSVTTSVPLSVSEKFREDIRDNLETFVASDMKVLPFSCGFSQPEIKAIEQIASTLGLKTVVPEHGDVKLKIFKEWSAKETK